jgi:hypothetical protein
VRKLSKAHLSFVRGQPCLICQQSPSDPHHLKFAQQRALGRKVSDEFTVPLCRPHHQDLHRHGNEKAWWANMQIAPMPIAKQLWDASQTGGQEQAAVSENAAHTHQYPRDSQHEAPFILLKACGAPQQSAPIQSEGELSAFSSSFQRLAHYLLRPPSTRRFVGPPRSTFNRSRSAHSFLDLRQHTRKQQFRRSN